MENFDRSAVMRFAWRQWRYAKSRGWDAPGPNQQTFGYCLRWAWKVYRIKKERARWREVEIAAQSCLPQSEANLYFLGKTRSSGYQHPLHVGNFLNHAFS